MLEDLKRDMNESKFVVFRLENERYAFPIESVERILPDQSVTRIPRTPKMLLGFFDMRGTTVPAIDARIRFEMEACDHSQNMVVVLTEQGRCAVRVDSVEGIETYSEDEIESKSVILDKKSDEFMLGIAKKASILTVLIDPDKLVPSKVTDKVAKVA